MVLQKLPLILAWRALVAPGFQPVHRTGKMPVPPKTFRNKPYGARGAPYTLQCTIFLLPKTKTS
jgi:hypothetical protein